MHVNLSNECITMIEALTPLKTVVEKVKIGRLWEVPIDDHWYRVLLNQRRPDESWSEVIMRLIRENLRLREMMKDA